MFPGPGNIDYYSTTWNVTQLPYAGDSFDEITNPTLVRRHATIDLFVPIAIFSGRSRHREINARPWYAKYLHSSSIRWRCIHFHFLFSLSLLLSISRSQCSSENASYAVVADREKSSQMLNTNYRPIYQSFIIRNCLSLTRFSHAICTRPTELCIRVCVLKHLAHRWRASHFRSSATHTQASRKSLFGEMSNNT